MQSTVHQVEPLAAADPEIPRRQSVDTLYGARACLIFEADAPSFLYSTRPSDEKSEMIIMRAQAIGPPRETIPFVCDAFMHAVWFTDRDLTRMVLRRKHYKRVFSCLIRVKHPR
jgi:hypothetical protein